MKSFGVADVVARASDAVFGKPLVTNVLRGQIVEAMIALALEPDWTWCAADYHSWDFERSDGRRLEVKQSALKQTWAPPAHGRVNPSFDIRERVGRWVGAAYFENAGRPADLYIFAFHSMIDESADHRDPAQWEFYVVPTANLPMAQRISLNVLRRLTPPIQIGNLKEAVEAFTP